jgi:hypothetical protein
MVVNRVNPTPTQREIVEFQRLKSTFLRSASKDYDALFFEKYKKGRKKGTLDFVIFMQIIWKQLKLERLEMTEAKILAEYYYHEAKKRYSLSLIREEDMHEAYDYLQLIHEHIMSSFRIGGNTSETS